MQLRLVKTDEEVKFGDLKCGKFFSIGNEIYRKVSNKCDYNTVNAFLVYSDITMSQEEIDWDIYDYVMYNDDKVNICKVKNET